MKFDARRDALFNIDSPNAFVCWVSSVNLFIELINYRVKQADWSSTWKKEAHSTSSHHPPRCEKSLKSLCSSFLSDKEESVGNKISHLNGFLIDSKSIKGNRMEQQCSEQHKRQFPARFTQPLAVYGLALPFHRIDSDMK